MAGSAPAIRNDRTYLQEAELYVLEKTLYALAEMVNSLVAAGPLYGQVLLSPEEAERKRQLMQQPPEGGADVQY